MIATNIRQEARNFLNGKWGTGALIVLCYFLVQFGIGFLQSSFSKNSSLSIIISIADLVISVPLTFGFLISFLRLKRGESVKPFDFLTSGFSLFGRAWSVTFSMLLKVILPLVLIIVSMLLIFGVGFAMISSSNGILTAASSSRSKANYETQLEEAQLALASAKATYYENSTSLNYNAYQDAKDKYEDLSKNKPQSVSTTSTNSNSPSAVFVILMILGFVLFIACMIFLYAKLLLYVLSYFIAYDQPNLSAKEVVINSKQLMKGNRGNLFVLFLSFIGWVFLCSFTFGIGYLWLIPYMQLAFVCFYDNLIQANNPASYTINKDPSTVKANIDNTITNDTSYNNSNININNSSIGFDNSSVNNTNNEYYNTQPEKDNENIGYLNDDNYGKPKNSNSVNPSEYSVKDL